MNDETKKKNDFIKNKYDQVRLLVPKGEREELKQLAEDRGQSVNSLINELVNNEKKIQSASSSVYTDELLTLFGEIYFLMCKLCNRNEPYLYGEAQTFPYKIITLLHHRMNGKWSTEEAQKIEEKMIRVSTLISETDCGESSAINVLMSVPVPMDLRGYFITGYYKEKVRDEALS